MKAPEVIGPLVFVAIAGLAAYSKLAHYRQLKRIEFIRGYNWPPGLLDKLAEHQPNFKRKEAALVGQGLRQFFVAYLLGERQYVAMPSKIVDELWHEFILYTREYQSFCKNAFGDFFHHRPAVVLNNNQRASNEGLRRVWWNACRDENIDPAKPTRLPVLFALDAKLNIKDGYHYAPDCAALRADGKAGTQCGADMSNPGIDGTIKGFGKPRRDGASCGGGCGGGGGGCGGDGGGCGGGCGGD